MMCCAGCLCAVLVAIALYYVCKNMFRKQIDVTGRAVFITGCDTGFGYRLTERLAEMGVTVFAACINQQSNGAQTLAKLDNVSVIEMDVTSQDDVDKALEVVEKNLDGRKLWALVNNAGIGGTWEIELTDMSTYQRFMDVNYFGVVRVTKAFLPLIRAAKGRVVNVASGAGRVANARSSSYAATKFACIAFSDSLRREMKQFGIKVATIEPFLYKTGIVDIERLVADNTKQWESASDEIHSAYGDDYFRATIAQTRAYAKTANSNIDEVIDCMIDAIISTCPNKQYVPNRVRAFIIFVMMHVSYDVADFIINRILIPKK